THARSMPARACYEKTNSLCAGIRFLRALYGRDRTLSTPSNRSSTMKQAFAKTLSLASLAVLPMLASAQTADASAAPAAAPAPNLTGNVSLTTDYKFRGQDQDTIGHNGFAK